MLICRMIILRLSLAISLLFGRGNFSARAIDFEQACVRLAAKKGDDALRLHQLFDLDWKHTLANDPEFATDVGDSRFNDRWQDRSLAAIDLRKQEIKAPVKVILSINRARLSANDQLNYDLFRRNVEDALEGSRFNAELAPMTQLNGIQQDLVRTLTISPHARLRDFDDMLARLDGIPKVVDQTIALMQKGLETGITPPRVTLREVGQQIKNVMPEDPDGSPFMRAFTELPAGIPPEQGDRIKRSARNAIRDKVTPAFARLLDFFEKSYLPHARQGVSMTELPHGKEWYAFNVRTSTTTRRSPEDIHELGLSEVKRIHSEMDKVIRSTSFLGGFSNFCQFLRTDPRFFFQDSNSLLTAYRDIVKRADPELAKLFGKLPRLPYGVKAVPSYAEKSQTTAYYEPGSPSAGRPGYYFANTFALDTRPKWEMEALSLHESVPGHHLQIALAQEMEDAPDFRKNGGYTAFVEGWGLYAEGLGEEMGFYKDPYMKFGQLTYEMWRAVRLVVDTGLHSKGWTRQQAIDFFLANTSKSEHDVTVEVDRYIVWPGQALAYKIGQLKFKELRAYATRELGDAFDIRKFHDQLLDAGAMPLDLVERRLKQWVAERQLKGTK
jgi:uncharacterized protein (DUF885 family)